MTRKRQPVKKLRNTHHNLVVSEGQFSKEKQKRISLKYPGMLEENSSSDKVLIPKR